MALNRYEALDLMRRRRLQILVHSVIYYRFNDSLISDQTWSKWAVELEALQKEYPEIAEMLPWSDEFRDFNHSTGYNLPLNDPWAIGTARQLLSMKYKHAF
jgi:hypothetical protein